MTLALTQFRFATCLIVAVTFCGCLKIEETPTQSRVTVSDHHDHHDHAHPSEGPHHGELIELGKEEYHAELLHDDESGTVTIYVLDSSATKPIPIDATQITVNTTHEGTPQQFKLAASPDESDPAGKSSRFVSGDRELTEHLDEEGADHRLVLTINGKSYQGEIAHDHNHHHDHEHEHE